MSQALEGLEGLGKVPEVDVALIYQIATELAESVEGPVVFAYTRKFATELALEFLELDEYGLGMAALDFDEIISFSEGADRANVERPTIGTVYERYVKATQEPHEHNNINTFRSELAALKYRLEFDGEEVGQHSSYWSLRQDPEFLEGLKLTKDIIDKYSELSEAVEIGTEACVIAISELMTNSVEKTARLPLANFASFAGELDEADRKQKTWVNRRILDSLAKTHNVQAGEVEVASHNKLLGVTRNYSGESVGWQVTEVFSENSDLQAVPLAFSAIAFISAEAPAVDFPAKTQAEGAEVKPATMPVIAGLDRTFGKTAIAPEETISRPDTTREWERVRKQLNRATAEVTFPNKNRRSGNGFKSYRKRSGGGKGLGPVVTEGEIKDFWQERQKAVERGDPGSDLEPYI